MMRFKEMKAKEEAEENSKRKLEKPHKKVDQTSHRATTNNTAKRLGLKLHK